MSNENWYGGAREPNLGRQEAKTFERGEEGAGRVALAWRCPSRARLVAARSSFFASLLLFDGSRAGLWLFDGAFLSAAWRPDVGIFSVWR